jgi:Fur family transcriptional regulator, ferric uptake regulator
MTKPVSTIGRRSTKQRTAVIDSLQRHDDFRSSQEIHDELRHAGTSVGLSTVYRTLQALAEVGEVDVIVRDDGESVYRLCSEQHHHHLVCRRCRTTVELQAPSVETWAQQVAAEHGFTETAHTFEIWGLCPDCAGSHEN